MLRARLNIEVEVEPPGIFPFLEASPDSATPRLDNEGFPLVDGSAVLDESLTQTRDDAPF
jgi:hypothetical protein